MAIEARIADNEATFRELNEAIEEGRTTRTGPVGFLCECGLLGCNEVVELTISEYESVRADGRRFFVRPGHDTEVDDVLERKPDHLVVVKRGRAGEVAERLDPRGER
jgi:hypothetical protein